MFDSTKAADVPAGSQLVAGYVDGDDAWTDADFAAFPGRTVVRLCIWSNRYDAQVIDCEPGNNDAKGIVPWVAEKWRRDATTHADTPTAYCETDEGVEGYRIKDIVAECDAAGVRLPLFWVAHYDGIAELPTYPADPRVVIVAKQYANPKLTGGHYDASVVADSWPGVERSVTVAPKYAGQSADRTGSSAAKQGEIVRLAAAWDYGDGKGPRWIERKVWAHTAGRYIVTILPPVDPDADPTEHLDASPATFVVDVSL